MQRFRAHTLFIISLTPCKPLFLCSVLNSHRSIFLLPPKLPQGQELPLAGPWNTVLCLLFIFFFLFLVYYDVLVLWDSEKTWKNILLWLTPASRMQKCRPQFHISCKPALFSTESIVLGAPFFLCNSIYHSKFDVHLSFFFQNGLQMMFCITQVRRTLNVRMC